MEIAHGGLNDMSSWRQSAMNQMFPDDKTKTWSEIKAGMGLHNKAMGNLHEDIYKTGETIKQVRSSISKSVNGGSGK